MQDRRGGREGVSFAHAMRGDHGADGVRSGGYEVCGFCGVRKREVGDGRDFEMEEGALGGVGGGAGAGDGDFNAFFW